MPVKFFGQFLIERGAVSRDMLLQAIALQESVNRTVGQIVQQLGIMNEADIEKVNRTQRTVDMRFGDLAVKMGLLTKEQMQHVLVVQKETHLLIGEALVRVGCLTEEELKRHLEDFKADQAEFNIQRVEIPGGIPNSDLWEMMIDLSYKMFTRVARMSFRPAHCQLVKHMRSSFVAASMDFTGDIHCRFIITASEDIQINIAKAMLNQDKVSNESKEVLNDTVMELINVCCGNIAAKSNQIGYNLDITPPEIIDNSNGIEIPLGYIGISVPLCFADKGHAAITIIIYP